MDTNNNLYTVIYATVMVVIVASVLAFASSLLKERQQRNVETERMEMILRSVQLGGQVKGDKDTFIENEYARYITDSSVTVADKNLVLYICTLDNGERLYIFPLRGAGLWGPVWGYISLRSDFNTIYGATFDHKSETPGLGAEITTPAFYNQFRDKKIFDADGNFVSVKVVKGGARAGNVHQVDAISGGTITSNAVEEMMFNNIKEYLGFIEKKLSYGEEDIYGAVVQE